MSWGEVLLGIVCVVLAATNMFWIHEAISLRNQITRKSEGGNA